MKNFWHELFSKKKIILGLSPMDGVTDVAMRYMTAKYGSNRKSSDHSPIVAQGSELREGVDVLFTEFVSVDALHYATGERRERLLKTFMRAKDILSSNRETPPAFGVPTGDFLVSPVEESPFPFEIAQVFGHTIDYFKEAAEIIEKLGFDGIDINMGCPAHKVEDNGSGAGLIRTPKLAQEIVKIVKASTKLPVSVKTRIGVTDKSEMEEWISALMEVEPAVISLHGRTLKQMYTGSADWGMIGRAAEIVHKHGGHILGNGDVMNLEDARTKADKYSVDGVLIGRAAEGNPGIFVEPQSSDHSPIITQGSELWVQRQIAWMVEHAKIFEKIFPENFMPMRKHLAWYCSGFPGASNLREQLVRVSSVSEVIPIINKALGTKVIGE